MTELDKKDLLKFYDKKSKEYPGGKFFQVLTPTGLKFTEWARNKQELVIVLIQTKTEWVGITALN